ncbi:hypothetical protein CCB80_09740 [Armatimonadetes bacterium Uphvl-Ar1]|nr:hypothetical protein CCB80_09740 [Armatimonadetes bacterium Uphvl-Ar1]
MNKKGVWICEPWDWNRWFFALWVVVGVISLAISRVGWQFYLGFIAFAFGCLIFPKVVAQAIRTKIGFVLLCIVILSGAIGLALLVWHSTGDLISAGIGFCVMVEIFRSNTERLKFGEIQSPEVR